MAKISQMVESKYLKQGDVEDDTVVTITKVGQANIGKEIRQERSILHDCNIAVCVEIVKFREKRLVFVMRFRPHVHA